MPFEYSKMMIYILWFCPFRQTGITKILGTDSRIGNYITQSTDIQS